MHWLNDHELGAISLFDRFERATDAKPLCGPKLAPHFSVEPLRDDDRLTAAALVRSQLSSLVADAFDIHPHDLTSPALNGDPERTRTAVALRGGDVLVGVALCETGSPSASLFDIFNLAQFYFCAGCHRPPIDAQLGLLAAVRAFYRHRGVSSPIIVAPPGSFAAAHEPGTTLVESMGCMVMRGAALRQWEHYCRLQMGRLYQRKAPRALAGPREAQRAGGATAAFGGRHDPGASRPSSDEMPRLAGARRRQPHEVRRAIR